MINGKMPISIGAIFQAAVVAVEAANKSNTGKFEIVNAVTERVATRNTAIGPSQFPRVYPTDRPARLESVREIHRKRQPHRVLQKPTFVSTKLVDLIYKAFVAIPASFKFSRYPSRGQM